jgi:hypothetical protein
VLALGNVVCAYQHDQNLPPKYKDEKLREFCRKLFGVSSITAIPGAQYNYSGDGPPEELAAALVSRDLFDTLGVPFSHGGAWPESYDPERSFGVILTYDLWKRRFGGDPNVLGRKITLDAAPYYVVYGVAPRGFNFPGNVQLFRSIAISEQFPNYKDRSARNIYAAARLKPGVSYVRDRVELNAFSLRLAERAWSGQDPISKRLKAGGVDSQSKWTTIR